MMIRRLRWLLFFSNDERNAIRTGLRLKQKTVHQREMLKELR